MENYTLNKLRDEIHANAVKHGFYDIETYVVDSETEDGFINDIKHAFFAQQIALIHSELSEALEADRCSKYFQSEGTNDVDVYFRDVDKKGFKTAFEENIKNTVQDELADVIIRTLDLCGHFGIDIDFHLNEKMKYNAQREYKHEKNY